MFGIEYIMACQPVTSPQLIAAIIQVESKGNPLALHINGPLKLINQPTTVNHAIKIAHQVIKTGYSIDMGLMQINSENLIPLRLTLEQIFDPCINIKAGITILRRGYQKALRVHSDSEAALFGALSMYNTGNLYKGLHNGYVAKYFPVSTAAYKINLPKLSKKSSSISTLALKNPQRADTTVFKKRDDF